MNTIRVRLCFAPDLASKLNEQFKQCWMLVDVTVCKFVYDLEYLIRKNFFVDKKGLSLNLYLDDFLLPSKEKIQVIRDGDVIRVEDEQSLSTQTSGKFCANDANPKKRKLDNSGDSQKKQKKIKHCQTDKEEGVDEEKMTYKKKEKQSTLKGKSTKNGFKNGTCQKAMQFLHKVSQEVPRKISQGPSMGDENTAVTKKHERKGSIKKHERKGSVKKDGSLSKDLKPKALTKNTSNKAIVQESTSSVTKTGDKERGKTYSVKTTKDVSVGKEKDKSLKHKKSVSKNSKSYLSSAETSAPEKLSTSKYDNITEKLRAMSQGGENNVGPTVIVRGYKQQQQKERPGIQNNHGNHIRFDQDDDVTNKATTTTYLPLSPPSTLPLSAPTLLHARPTIPPFTPTHHATLPPPNIRPLVHPANKAITNTESPHLSPIHPILKNSIHPRNNKAPCSLNGQKFPNSKHGSNKFTKDVYTNKSIIMESTRVEKQPAQIQQDFSKYPVLHVPPRVGETVAYKILEMSQSYTPEISKYKVGKVLAFDPSGNKLKLKLTKDSLSRVEGDGQVSFKFELFEIDKENGEPIIEEVEISDEVDVVWSMMIDPRLVTPGN